MPLLSPRQNICFDLYRSKHKFYITLVYIIRNDEYTSIFLVILVIPIYNNCCNFVCAHHEYHMQITATKRWSDVYFKSTAPIVSFECTNSRTIKDK